MVAPFVTSTSGEEYRWIGSALSEALTDRLLNSGEAGVFSQKQWAAVLRERDIEARQILSEEDAEAIARQLGAETYIFGRYRASWPEVTLTASLFRVGEPKPIADATAEGTLENLPKLEAILAKSLLAKSFRVAAKAPPPSTNVLAWRHLSLCRDSLALQSIGPRARIWLPASLAQSALAHCRAALVLDKRLTQARAFEALALFIVDEQDQASKLIGEVVKSKKRAFGWADQIAFFILIQTGQEAPAIKLLEKSIAQRPGMLHARTTLGEFLLAKGDLAGARATFESALLDAPSQPWVLLQIGKIKSKQGDLAGGLADTEAALSLVPGDAVLLMEKASRLIDGERWAEAETTLREAMVQDPRLAAAYLRLGYVYLQTDQLELAGPILNKALYEADRESESRIKGYAHFDLAKLHARLHDDERAYAEIERARSVGFADRARFENDPDLKTLSETDRFKQLFDAKVAPSEATGSVAP